jgi:hypothetical protein
LLLFGVTKEKVIRRMNEGVCVGVNKEMGVSMYLFMMMRGK